MPRYALTANFSPGEIADIDNTCKTEGLLKDDGTPNHYAFMRKAAMSYCVACKDKEKKQDEQTRREGNPSGESPQTTGKTDTSDGNAEQQVGRLDLTLPEAANHADPDNFGL
jgi:hypothetical protein